MLQVKLVSFVIIYECSIASGVRSIEAITGPMAVKYLQSSRKTLQTLMELVPAKNDDLIEKVSALVQEKRLLEKEVEKFSSEQLLSNTDALLKKSVDDQRC